jgi:uncharacterized protein YjbJ (UPF0337 family)
MGAINDKIKGDLNQTAGAAKQAVGDAIDSPQLEGEGALQELKGKGQAMLGDVKEVVSEAIETATEKAKELANNAKEAIRRADH